LNGAGRFILATATSSGTLGVVGFKEFKDFYSRRFGAKTTCSVFQVAFDGSVTRFP